MEFSTRLKALRKGKKISQTALGEEIGVTLKQIQRYERGENEPTAGVLIALADYFDVPIGLLMGKSGTNLTEANLSYADMRDVKACGAIFVKANLTGTDLRNADLRWADFRDANLHNAKLEGAKLEGAVFDRADLSGTILEKKSD